MLTYLLPKILLAPIPVSHTVRSMSANRFGRAPVPRDKRSWSVPWPDYKPVKWSMTEETIGKPFCDPEIGLVSCPKKIFHSNACSDICRTPTFNPNFNQKDGPVDRRSYAGVYDISPDGYPLCPTGRTGACLRGRLGRWGPNHAADPIVTRWTTAEEDQSGHLVLLVALIKRGDIHCWALPGGMVDTGEKAMKTAGREFLEEAMSIIQANPEERKVVEDKLKDLFENGVKVWDGVIGDHRNSDNAWMESVAYHFHDESGVLNQMQLKAGDDAIDVGWFKVNKSLERVIAGAHLMMIRKAAERLNVSW